LGKYYEKRRKKVGNVKEKARGNTKLKIRLKYVPKRRKIKARKIKAKSA
jgi:hypothetical protein